MGWYKPRRKSGCHDSSTLKKRKPRVLSKEVDCWGQKKIKEKRKLYSKEDLENLVKERENDKFERYLSTYGEQRSFESVWAVKRELYPMETMDECSSFKTGNKMTLTQKYHPEFCHSTSGVVGGHGTWGDVWSACDSAIRNLKWNTVYGNYDRRVHILDFLATTDENVFEIKISTF